MYIGGRKEIFLDKFKNKTHYDIETKLAISGINPIAIPEKKKMAKDKNTATASDKGTDKTKRERKYHKRFVLLADGSACVFTNFNFDGAYTTDGKCPKGLEWATHAYKFSTPEDAKVAQGCKPPVTVGDGENGYRSL